LNGGILPGFGSDGIIRSGRVHDLTHGGYDNSDANKDINCMFPLDRLRELAAAGVIKEVAPIHVGFMGGGGDVQVLADVTGPAIARLLRAERVDAVLMTAG
jgi:D-proline reductase (dithiol) PrdB